MSGTATEKKKKKVKVRESRGSEEVRLCTRRGARGHTARGELEEFAIDLDLHLVRKLGLSKVHINPTLLQGGGGVLDAQLGPYLAHAGHHLLKLHADFFGLDSIGVCLFNIRDHPGHLNQGGRGDRARDKRVAPEEVSFHNGDFGPKTGGVQGGSDSSATSPNHHEIIRLMRIQVVPRDRASALQLQGYTQGDQFKFKRVPKGEWIQTKFLLCSSNGSISG